MKKISVLLLAFALTLSMAAVASAAEFDPYLGGEFQVTYWGGEELENQPIITENGGTWARFKMMLTGTVEDEATGTWAKIGTKLSTWNTDEAAPIYEAGIKGIGGVLDIWYNGHEYENAKRGQIPLWVPIAKFGGDPLFDVAPGNVFAADFNSGNVTLNFGYDLNKPGAPTGDNENKNTIIGAGTFNLDDASDLHFAFVSRTADVEGISVDELRFLVGGQYNVGMGTLYLDYISSALENDDLNVDETLSIVQAAFSLDELGLKATVVSDDKWIYADGGMGFGLEYTGIENLTLGARMMQASEEGDDEKSNLTDFYVGYNYGVFETRLGVGKIGEDSDNVFYASAHVGMW